MKRSEIRYYSPKKKSTFILDPKSYHAALKDPFELKELESYNMVKSHIENFKKIAVMTSHGKDSLVLTHMVCMASRELKMEDKIEYWLNNTLNLYPEEKDFEDNTDLKGNKIVTFIDRTPAQYYKEICELVPTLKGNWIICSNHNRKSLIKWAEENNYYWKKIESTKTIMSHTIKVLCVSNKPFVKRGNYQATLL